MVSAVAILKRSLLPRRFPTNDMPTVNFLSNHSIAEEGLEYKPVYIFCANVDKKIRRDRYFLLTLLRQIHDLSDCPIFHTEEQVTHYARFMSPKHVILKIQLPEHAIQTNGRRLFIKHNHFVHVTQIESYWLGWSHSKRFKTNPLFNKTLQPQPA